MEYCRFRRSGWEELRSRTPGGCLCLVTSILLVALLSIPASAQSQTPLSLDQILELIRLRVPDAAIAREIATRGLNFAPSKDILEQLRAAGVGPETLRAFENLLPMLDEAKKAIPGVLQQIYRALNDGSPSAVRHLMSQELAATASKLDFICRPFTYRAHYVESIVERPNRLFLARVRALFQPLEERAYVLLFRESRGSFQLIDAGEPAQEWFEPHLNAAAEIARRFVYAVAAGREEIARQLLSPGLRRFRPADAAAFAGLKNVQIEKISHQARVASHKGLKLAVTVSVFTPERRRDALAGLAGIGRQGQSGQFEFLLDFIGVEPMIVGWQEGTGSRATHKVEDPQLESLTLARFGLMEHSSAAAVPRLEEYFEVSARLRRSEYSLTVRTGDKPTTGKMVVTFAGERNIQGRTYVQAMRTYSGILLPGQVIYERVGPEGVYVLEGDNPDTSEYLRIPFPVAVGASWTDAQQRTYRVEGIETIEVNGQTYEDCLKLAVQDPQWKSEFYLARQTGMVKLVQRDSGHLVEASLLRVEDISPEAIVRFQPQRATVRHRHLGVDPSGRLSAFQPSYCEGELSVTTLGDIKYVCSKADPYRKRCERVFFPTIKEVQLRDGGLRITLQNGSNWDFYGAAAAIRALYESLSAVVARQTQP